jgi:hypothetical protein
MAKPKRLCTACRQRPAQYRVHGGPVKSDDQHTLCFQCYRAEKNRQRQASLPPRRDWPEDDWR